MTIARKQLVDTSVTRWYHCISRCVRGAHLCGEGFEHRKQWIEQRLELLAGNFAVAVAGFAVMDNHLHVLLRLDPQKAAAWSGEEVLRRWLAVYPPPSMDTGNDKIVTSWIEQEGKRPGRVETLRGRLCELGWFMKALKEPLSRLANAEDGARGAFWEGRYKSIAVLDEEALLATCAYIDLNPLAAGQASTPESSSYTSLRQRVVHVRAKGELDRLKGASQGSVAGSRAAGDVEQDHWLVPIEDRRRHTGASPASDREGMLETFSLGSYLLLLDYTGRQYRSGKARMSPQEREVFARLGTDEQVWGARMKKMLSARDLRGRYFAVEREKLEAISPNSHRRLPNLSPQTA
jgi:hypothetical protein